MINARNEWWRYGVYVAVAATAGIVLLELGLRFLNVLLPQPLPPALSYVLFVLVVALAGWRARSIWRRQQRLRRGYEQLLLGLFLLIAVVAILITVGIVASVAFEAIAFFRIVPLHEFLFGVQWSPQIAIRADQVGGSGAFGFIPLLVGTLLISGIAMLVATPIGLLAAIYMSEFAPSRTRRLVKPILEILAGVPTIVYGFFAVVFLSPLLVDLGKSLGVKIASENALAAGLVMGAMLIPIIASLAEDAFYAVPDSLRQGSFGLGATRAETALQVVVPAALPGVVAGILLAFSRAVGETMIVVMAAGISANLSVNPLEAVTTVTVQIVTLLTGDQTFDDAKTLAAFALGLVLFVITLFFNLIALQMVRKYRERYE
ncbi:MAG: phosphate ABC transporter permease subunit PstC [Proteobacteria bacterium]|nr:phosphate ABC transporter permease subunit PstC [Pseudomonadota bacterium]